ncbi:MAG: hypothetical protein LC102_12360 [Ignavibacteriales bacterium]|nr:MAG: hypothetical protein F9K26_09245 [Ignavibacteriaceae bacterium]MBW7874106.1 hypothetical protein [Ignavibacteria bacterium]MCZ2144204.1 hypothetical protein [Ignavibacteriales bacterium]OQY69676.1 MAG: hypothetical protein B6D45_12435 [Ignavibacteriales bacterium UTCHB3]MBV6444564.1 hypothetical protein [Ignavibacteriaceae bacterium]
MENEPLKQHKISEDTRHIYTVPNDHLLKKSLNLAEKLREEIDTKKPIEGDLWKTIEEKLLIEWTYNSNAIEGSSLTQGETAFFLKSGLTVEGKPLKDFLDAKNHAEAISFLYDVITDSRQISPGLIKKI